VTTSSIDSLRIVELLDGVRNVPAEEALLSTILCFPNESHAVGLDEVREELFTSHVRCEIWREIAATMKRGERIDLRLIGERLVGRVDPLEVIRICELVPSAANFRERLDACVDARRKDLLVKGAVDILRLASDKATRADELEQLCAGAAARSRDVTIESDTTPIGEVLRSLLDQLDRRSRGESAGVVECGIGQLDSTLGGGFPRGSLNVVAARPGFGKTSLALQTARSVARRGDPVLVVTLEMSALELGAKFLASASDSVSIRSPAGKIDGDELAELRVVAESEGGIPLHFAEPRRFTLPAILSIVRQDVARRGTQFVVIDYLQLIDAPSKYVSRNDQVALVSRQLKQLARELGIPLLVVAQLNRQPEGRPDAEPRVSDLRDSGSIEQDADSVLLLHWPWKHDASKPRDRLELIVGKNRHGPTGRIALRFDPARGRFDDADPLAVGWDPNAPLPRNRF
jgi:replicative DNA helicase